MAKISPNLPCPCGSGVKYKKCCLKYHKGARPANALLLMRSRYSAYAFGLAKYIIETTHTDNTDYTENREKWTEEILSFSNNTEFQKLSIIAFIDGEEEAFVTFEAVLSSGLLREKSRFLKEGGKWFYVDGEYGISERDNA